MLGRPGRDPLRFSDVARELHLTQATAHAILKTMSDRGWISRDPVDKTFALGPALAVVAHRADVTRSLAHTARAAAKELSAEFGFRASVLERHGESLIITAHEGGHPSDPGGRLGERIPYAPPFGVAFAAWDSPEGQLAWIHRTAESNPPLARNLSLSLARTRERGYDVDLTTPALAQTAQLVGALLSDGMPAHVRRIMDQLLVETMVGFTGDDRELAERPVATIAGPVLNQHGCVAMILAVHPLRPQTSAEIAIIGRRVTAAAAAIAD
uniref:helix-turn-helix domain-containing protein n=1 Tax=Mycolicibacterium sp. TUM20985 TaxID=3023370 RepID=UPI002572D70B|nr:helix-turn-helix domain-containing protein [Mycolicibacterium sp. TUM20985]